MSIAWIPVSKIEFCVIPDSNPMADSRQNFVGSGLTYICRDYAGSSVFKVKIVIFCIFVRIFSINVQRIYYTDQIYLMQLIVLSVND